MLLWCASILNVRFTIMISLISGDTTARIGAGAAVARRPAPPWDVACSNIYKGMQICYGAEISLGKSGNVVFNS
jgi:hypothetical protein